MIYCYCPIESFCVNCIYLCIQNIYNLQYFVVIYTYTTYNWFKYFVYGENTWMFSAYFSCILLQKLLDWRLIGFLTFLKCSFCECFVFCARSSCYISLIIFIIFHSFLSLPEITLHRMDGTFPALTSLRN